MWLADLLEACVFFREMLNEAVQAQVRHEGARPDQVVELWRRMNGALNGVLLAVAAVFERLNLTAVPF